MFTIVTVIYSVMLSTYVCCTESIIVEPYLLIWLVRTKCTKGINYGKHVILIITQYKQYICSSLYYNEVMYIIINDKQ